MSLCYSLLPPLFFDPLAIIKHYNKGELLDGVENYVKMRNVVTN